MAKTVRPNPHGQHFCPYLAKFAQHCSAVHVLPCFIPPPEDVCSSKSGEESLESIAKELQVKDFVILSGTIPILRSLVYQAGFISPSLSKECNIIRTPQTQLLSSKGMPTGSLSLPSGWYQPPQQEGQLT